MKLSALDLMTMNNQQTTAEKFNDTIALAKKLDDLGYHRLWFAEHHGSPVHASSAPEVAAAFIAGATKNIRVGTGGTMIMHYSPLKIAEQFKTLAAFAHGRVDLGIGRAPGGNQEVIQAMAQGKEVYVDDLYEKIATILAYISDESPERELYRRIKASPQKLAALPEAWLLGSTGNSAIKAGEMGMSYNFATFFGVTSERSIFDLYRQHFVPSQFSPEPKIMSAYEVIVADTDEEADYIARPLEIARLLQMAHKFAPTLSPQDAQKYPLTPVDERAIGVQYQRRILIKGSPATVADILRDEQEKYGFDELMIYSPIFDHAARIRSYELLMEAFK